MPSYNRFSHHARRALTHAGLLVTDFRHPRVDTSHLFVGVMKTEGSVGHTVLMELGINLEDALYYLRTLTLSLDEIPTVINHDAALDMALDLAKDESAWLGHHYVGTAHLLLGMTRTNLGNASDLVRKLNVSPEHLRRRVKSVLSDGLTEFSIDSVRRNARFSELSRRVVTASEQLSISLDHKTIGVGHLLIAMTRERRGIVPILLRASGVEQQRLIEDMRSPSPALLTSIEPVLDKAVDIAESFSSHYTGTEHLLLALVLDEQYNYTLGAYGINVRGLKEAIIEQINNKR